MSPLSDIGNGTLLVEGKDDVHVISKLLAKYKLSVLRDSRDKGIYPLKLHLLLDNHAKVPLDIYPCEDENDGRDDKVTAITEKFKARIINARSNTVVIGLVLDNDHGHRGKQIEGVISRAIQERKEKANVDFRWKNEQHFQIMTPGGYIAEPDNEFTPRIGCWLMPDHQNEGMLETFLAKLVSNHGLFDHAKHAAQTAKEEHKAPYKDCHADKAIMHTYLAWQDEPGQPFGTAFELTECFNPDHHLAGTFVNWIKELFRPRIKELTPCQHPES